MNSSPLLSKLYALLQGRWLAPWPLLALLAAMTVWGLVDVRGRGSCDPNLPWKHKSDLTVFTEAGAAFFDGRPPYQVRNPRGWSYVYPPVFAMLVPPLHVLPMPDQTTVWFFLCLAMCWGAYRECRRIVALVCRSEAERSAAARCFPWLA